MNDYPNRIRVLLEDGTEIFVETTQQVGTTQQDGLQDVGATTFKFAPIAKTIESITKVLADSINKAKPSKATVKFGLEISIGDEGLMAILLPCTGKANLEISLEWKGIETPKA